MIIFIFLSNIIKKVNSNNNLRIERVQSYLRRQSVGNSPVASSYYLQILQLCFGTVGVVKIR
jgi:hypothetical protein